MVSVRKAQEEGCSYLLGEVGLSGLTEAHEEVATNNTLLWRLVLGEREHVHEQAAQSGLVILDRTKYGGQSFIDLLESVLVLLRLERALESIDDVGEATAEGRAGDADQRSKSTGVEGGDGRGDEARDEDGEDLLRADLHDLLVKMVSMSYVHHRKTSCSPP